MIIHSPLSDSSGSSVKALPLSGIRFLLPGGFFFSPGPMANPEPQHSAELLFVFAVGVADAHEVFATNLSRCEAHRTGGEPIRASADLKRNRSGYGLATVRDCDTRLRCERRGAPGAPHFAEPATRPKLD